MRGFISKLTLSMVVISSLFIFGCSSDDGGSSGGGTVPTGATEITEDNAVETVASAISIGTTLVDSVPYVAQITPSASYRDIIEFVADKARNAGSSGIAVSIPTGVVETYPCSGGGEITIDYTDTATGTSGTVTLNNCNEYGVILNGTFTFSSTYNPETSDYSDSIQGNISGSLEGITFSLTNLVLTETGNYETGDYSIDQYTYTADSSAGGGFFVELLAAIVGNDFDYSCPKSGIILVTGANNTQAKATINDNDTVTVEFNDGSGTFVEVTTPPPGSPYPCDYFFSYYY